MECHDGHGVIIPARHSNQRVCKAEFGSSKLSDMEVGFISSVITSVLGICADSQPFKDTYKNPACAGDVFLSDPEC
jgi:hypothetical protein